MSAEILLLKAVLKYKLSSLYRLEDSGEYQLMNQLKNMINIRCKRRDTMEMAALDDGVN